ncbi:hypothetical protein NQZ68_004480 [Dissostichus eleginoides]|nr:hypothetical protein NQZ68_004480 [Dissostichus eleginoides]
MANARTIKRSSSTKKLPTSTLTRPEQIDGPRESSGRTSLRDPGPAQLNALSGRLTQIREDHPSVLHED